jgi:hypothetical protein
MSICLFMLSDADFAMTALLAHLRLIESFLDGLVPDELRCPISGLVMHDPVVASDGITYSRAALLDWMRTNGSRSPVSGELIDASGLVVNRAAQDMAEEIRSDALDEAGITRLRLKATLYWMTKSKFTIPPDFQQKAPDFRGRWPMQVDPKACAQLAWDVFPRLRSMVYVQFASCLGPTTTEDAIKRTAEKYFVSALALIKGTKTQQLTFALRCTYYVDYLNSQTHRQWRAFWSE